MVENASGNYREKYFQALKDQERIEKQTGLQLELLRKTMFSLATAASGMDQQLDANVMRLREVVRGGSGAQVADQIDRVQASVENFERTRSVESTKAAKSMGLLIEQFLELQMPADIKASLASFKKALQKRLTNYRQYPIALEDLAKLQQLALEAAANPKAGLWTRLKGGKTLTTELQARAQEANTGAAENSQAFPEEPAPPLPAGGELSGVDEDSYEQVSARIASTLTNLVDKIEPNDVIKHRVDIVRHRIERGMDWYVLAVTLEDIRDILFLRYLQADEEFSEYLNQVKEELGTIRNSLANAVELDADQNSAADTFSDRVSTGVGGIKKSVEEHDQVDELKQEVTGHINYIADALKEFKAQRSESLTDRLQSLVNQVQNIERESQRTQEALEEQRHKATHDPLTGLPNREAYSERAYHEMQRFKRYCRPLTLAICDIDYFKKINDSYGHQAGDKVLKLIAKVVSTRLRKVDFIARFGGEEFVLLMPETTAEQAFKVLDKIRSAVGNTPFRFKEDPVQITISFGMSAFVQEDTLESVFERADKALYKAKSEGRNRCIIEPCS